MGKLSDSYFKFIKKMIPSRVQGTVVGLEFGLSACKVVELAKKGDGFEVVRWMVEPVDGADEKGMLGRLASALGAAAKSRLIVASVGGKGTLIRYVDMPQMSKADLQRAFMIEADKYFPFPKDSVYTDCQILETVENGRKMMVLVAAVKKDLVDSRLKQLKDSGLEVEAVSLHPAAVASVFAAFPPAGSSANNFKACAIIDIGEGVTDLMIMAGGLPRFNRDIFIGTQDVYKRVANLAGVSPEEARGLVAPEVTPPEAILAGIGLVIGGLVAEVRLSFDYFTTEKNLAVSQIFIVGDGAALPGVLKAFTDGFDIPVGKWDPLEKISLAPDVDKARFLAAAPGLVTAFGSALAEYDQA